MRILNFVVLALLLTVGAAAQQLPDQKPAAGLTSHPSTGSNTVDVEIVSDTKGTGLALYLTEVLSQIRDKWYEAIPDEARAPVSNSESSTIEFILSTEGTIADAKVALSAGDESFDRAALDAVKSAAPFPRLPSTFEGGFITLRGTFTYNQPAQRLTFLQILSPGSQIEQAARATASGDFGGNLGAGRSNPQHTPAPRIPQGVEVLSDTQGVDFSDYLYSVRHAVANYWYEEMPTAAKPPERKSGTAKVEFNIMRDGRIAGIKMAQSSGDTSLDRAAWNAIAKTALTWRLAMPPTFKGQDLRLRFTFQYNPTKASLEDASKNETH